MSDLYCVYKHTTPNGKVYIGQTKAGIEKTGINASNIQCCASGRNKTAGGYQWKYVV